MATSSNEILMQCLNCSGKKLCGISCKRFQSRAPLTDQERDDIKAELGFCARDQCHAVRAAAMNFPEAFKNKFHALFAEYFNAIDAFYLQTLSRAEFTVKRSYIKRNLVILRKEVDIYRAGLLADAAEKQTEAGEIMLENQSRKRRRVLFHDTDNNNSAPPMLRAEASRLTYHMQVLVNNYFAHMRQVNANPDEARAFWVNVLRLPPALFNAKLSQEPPLQMLNAHDFAVEFESFATP